MKIISRNVNGIRAVLQKGFLDFVKQENPDILCLQEVKAFEHQMPTELRFAMQDYDYVWHRSERPGYAGTAIFYRKSLEIAKNLNQFPECPLMNDDGRVTAIERSDFMLFNIYFPNGGERADGTEMLSYKLKFYQEYQQEVQRLIQAGKKVITTGDFNICHRPIDIARPKENENSIWIFSLLKERNGQNGRKLTGLMFLGSKIQTYQKNILGGAIELEQDREMLAGDWIISEFLRI